MYGVKEDKPEMIVQSKYGVLAWSHTSDACVVLTIKQVERLLKRAKKKAAQLKKMSKGKKWKPFPFFVHPGPDFSVMFVDKPKRARKER